MIGIGIDDPAQARRFEILVITLAEVHNDRSPPCYLGHGFDRELALAIRSPTPTFALASLPALDLDLFGDHERRVESDTKLADQAHILSRVSGELVNERGGARAGDGAEIFDQLGSVHADAVI